MRRLFPDDRQRLRHIFEKRMLDVAPTGIILRIAEHYTLGFLEDADTGWNTHFVLGDTESGPRKEIWTGSSAPTADRCVKRRPRWPALFLTSASKPSFIGRQSKHPSRPLRIARKTQAVFPSKLT